MFLSSRIKSIAFNRAVWRECRPHKISFVICFAVALSSLPLAAAPSEIQYNRDVRPILVENCFPCHGPDSAARKASLRLDRFDDAISPRKDQSPAIVPGKPAGSELIRRITAADPDDIMPPVKTKKT